MKRSTASKQAVICDPPRLLRPYNLVGVEASPEDYLDLFRLFHNLVCAKLGATYHAQMLGFLTPLSELELYEQ